jgi:hypothetical protein
LGIWAGAAEHIAGEFDFWKGAVPQVHGEALVRRAHCCDEVIFESSHGLFCCICGVHSGLCFLLCHSFVFHEVDWFLGAFVVQAVEQGVSASSHWHVEDVLEGGWDVVGTSGGNGSDIDGVAVAVAEQEDGVVSLAESDLKSAGQVRVNFACGGVPKVNVAGLCGQS